MLIFAGSQGSHITDFLTLIKEHDLSFIPYHYDQYDPCITPKGFVYLYVSEEIAAKRADHTAVIDFDSFQQIAHQYNIPLLKLNGNIDFRTDFSQFYNHLFYIKKFYQDLTNTGNKIQHRRCKC